VERVKFAVVREDPELELALVDRVRAKSVLLVASGGCAALTLLSRHPELDVSAFDINPRQLEHVLAKLEAAQKGDLRALNVEDLDPAGLNQLGAFEGLFRILRATIAELVTTERELASFFEIETEHRRSLLERWKRSPYWPAAFATTFNDQLLFAMFGPEATQHAEPGSYPAYFQRVFERGLAHKDAAHNPFLQHVFLGAYARPDAPRYITHPPSRGPALIRGSLSDVEDLARFDVYSLSNVFDWSDDRRIGEWADALARSARMGSAILIRQLNNQRDLSRFFAPAFEIDRTFSAELLARDRSLFYEKIEVYFRVR
jgi:S-adenosylmethionine-diacylglycerol 3-amino-3-carboxypropyl transferase